jgi:hypothetical protein
MCESYTFKYQVFGKYSKSAGAAARAKTAWVVEAGMRKHRNETRKAHGIT